MKTAICFSGLVRNYDKYIDHWVDFIKYWNSDVFIHTWNVFDQIDRKEIPNSVFNYINSLLSPKMFDYYNLDISEETFLQYKKWNFKKEDWHSKDAINFAGMYHSICESNQMRRNYQKITNINYDIVFRARFDFGFQDKLLHGDIKEGSLNLLPINRSDGYCDIFAAGSSVDMNIYSSLYMNYDECCENIKLMRPEDMLKYWIDKHNIPVNIINNKYLIK